MPKNNITRLKESEQIEINEAYKKYLKKLRKKVADEMGWKYLNEENKE